MSTGNKLQTAVYAALKSEPTLTALVGSRIYDDVPHSQETTTPAFPYVTIGEQTEVEAGADDIDLVDMTITLHCWSRAAGKKEAQDIMHAMRRALHNKSHPTSEGVIVFLLFDFAEGPSRDPDGETYHGVIRFKSLFQY